MIGLTESFLQAYVSRLSISCSVLFSTGFASTGVGGVFGVLYPSGSSFTKEAQRGLPFRWIVYCRLDMATGHN